MQRVGGVGVRPCLRPDSRDGLRVEPPEVGRARRVEPAPPRHRPRAAFFEGGIVEERIRLRVQYLVRERRRLRQVAHAHRDLPPLDAGEQRHEPVGIHGLVQRVVEGLPHERVIGDLALAGQVLRARDLVREHHRDEVFGLHPLDGGRRLAPARPARDRERHVRVPAPADVEQRRVEDRLRQHLTGGPAHEIPAHLVEGKAVRLAEREHDVVLGRGGL